MSDFLRRTGWLLGCAALGLRLAASWGVDASLSTHVKPEELPRYLELLAGTGVAWIGERGVETHDWASESRISQRGKFGQIKAAGHRVAAYAYLARLRPVQLGNALPEDLLSVFREGAELGGRFLDVVDAWQMVTEGDIGYCRDLPERTVAFQKAMYLGIKAGSMEQRARGLQGGATGWKQVAGSVESGGGGIRGPLVLMGAVGLPVSPWLQRATQNGLLEYTDAFNFHFYGLAESLGGEIDSHAAFVAAHAGRSLPLWITECGQNLIKPGDFLNPERRRMQAEFNVSTAAQALASPVVSIFMPFILVHENDPYAMTISPTQPLPAWEAYAKFTRENPWPKDRPLAAPPARPNPVVLQWLPDNATTIPHKVGGTYRFRGNAPITGELRVYNFSAEPVHGFLDAARPQHVAITAPEVENNPQRWRSTDLTVPAMEMVAVRVMLIPQTSAYFREYWQVDFLDAAGQRSPIFFGLERVPQASFFELAELPIDLRGPDKSTFPMYANYSVAGKSGPWLALNGLAVQQESEGWVRLSTPQRSVDPYFRNIAVASLPRGLPPHGMIRMKLDRPQTPRALVRLDLLDEGGRRFTIFENRGFSYFERGDEAWLNFEDFHTLSWGAPAGDGVLRPESVREIQLRFEADSAGAEIRVKLDLVWLPEESFNRWGQIH